MKFNFFKLSKGLNSMIRFKAPSGFDRFFLIDLRYFMSDN